MGDFREIRKRGGDKIGLLGLFVLAVLAAYFTVALKSSVKLSAPIQLPHSGLSISMPVGNGWNSEQRWMYHDNAFIVSSVFELQPGRATGWAYCQYRWGMKKAAAEDRFAWKASEIDGEIVETGRTQAEGLTVDWVRIERPDILLTRYWGTVELPNDRQLDIAVHLVMSDPVLSKRIFNDILKNLSFENDPSLEAGAEVAATIKRNGLDNILDNRNQRTFYLIKDSMARPIGFAMDVLMDSGNDTRLNVQGGGFVYIGGRNTSEQETLFKCSNNLNEFTYSSQIDDLEGRRGTRVVLDESGALTVTKFGRQSEEKKDYPGSAALPDVLFDHVFRQMVETDKRVIVVDLIDNSGKIIPTYIAGTAAENSEAAYVFDLEFMDGQGYTQRVFLDEQKQIFKSLIQQENMYILERTTAESVAKEFPQYARRILHNSRIL